MEPLVLIGVGSFVAVVGLVVFLAQPRRRERLGQERDYRAQAEIEEGDIAQMLEARNAIRRRRGLPEIDDDLVEELRRTTDPPPPPPPR